MNNKEEVGGGGGGRPSGSGRICPFMKCACLEIGCMAWGKRKNKGGVYYLEEDCLLIKE